MMRLTDKPLGLGDRVIVRGDRLDRGKIGTIERIELGASPFKTVAVRIEVPGTVGYLNRFEFYELERVPALEDLQRLADNGGAR